MTTADVELRRRVLEALRALPATSRVGVSVEDGVVTLAGSVPSLETRTAAEEIAARVAGVRSVNNIRRTEDAVSGPPIAREILVPVDLSDDHVAALRYARLFADRVGSHLTLLYADPLSPAAGQETPYEARLRRMVELFASPYLGPHPFDIAIERDASAAEAILRYAAAHGPDLILMDTSARTAAARHAAPSVSLAVVRRAPCPVLVRGTRDDPPMSRGAGITTVLCPVNFGPASRGALAYAARIAEAFEAHLIVLRVIEPDETVGISHEEERLEAWVAENLPARFMKLVRPFRQIVTKGPFAESLFECATKQRADLLVLGTDTSAAAVTERLVAAASIPTITVPLSTSEGRRKPLAA